MLVKEEEDAKVAYTIASRVAAYAEDWALVPSLLLLLISLPLLSLLPLSQACRRARKDDAMSTENMLSYAKSQSALKHALSTKLSAENLSKAIEASTQKAPTSLPPPPYHLLLSHCPR